MGAFLVVMALLVYRAGVTATMAALAVVGGLMEFTLYHASFGFTAAWRRFTTTGDRVGLRVQLLMLGVAVRLFLPAPEAGRDPRHTGRGLRLPLGTSVVVGAFMFGIGVQLGGGCGSGTLFTLGGGSTWMLSSSSLQARSSPSATCHSGTACRPWAASPRSPAPASAAHWLRGPWPILAGAVALTLLNFATLPLAGRPWGITSAFALWGEGSGCCRSPSG